MNLQTKPYSLRSHPWKITSPPNYNHRLWLILGLLVTGTFIINNAEAQELCPPSGVNSGAGPDSVTCLVQYQTARNELSKCVFSEFKHDDAPRIHMYHSKRSNLTKSSGYSYEADTAAGECDGENRQGYYQMHKEAGHCSESNSMTWAGTKLERNLGINCENPSVWYDGGGSTTTTTEDERYTTITINSGFCSSLETIFSQNQIETIDIRIEYGTYNTDKLGWYVHTTDSISGQIDHSKNVQGQGCTGSFGERIDSPTPADPGDAPLIDFTVPEDNRVSRTRATYSATSTTQISPCSLAPINVVETDQGTVDLEDEYTDEELWDNIYKGIPPYSGWYRPEDPAYYDTLSMVAYSVINGNHVNGLGWWTSHGGAGLQKMEYQFVLKGTKAGAMYRVSYDLVTWGTITGTVSVEHKSCDVAGGGEPTQETTSGIQEVLPPGWDNSREPAGGAVIIWVENVKAAELGRTASVAPGTGPCLSQAGGCATCGAGGAATCASSGGFYAEVSLGATLSGYAAHPLNMTAQEPSSILATPDGLNYDINDPGVEIVKVSEQIRQVKAPEAFVDIVVLDNFGYELRFYAPNEFSSVKNDKGVYTPIKNPEDPVPDVTWQIKNVDQSPECNHIAITETRGDDVKVYNWTYNVTAKSWKLAYPDGLREDEFLATTANASPFEIMFGGTEHMYPGYVRTVTTTMRLPGGPDRAKIKKVYQQYPWGEGLIEETLSPDTNPQTTKYDYYSGGVAPHLPPLKSVLHPNGSWEYRTYDNHGRILVSYSGLGDVALADPPSSASSRSFEYHYVDGDAYAWLVASQDDPSSWPDIPRVVVEMYQGTEVSRKYTIIPSADLRIDVQALAGASWDAANNLFTTNRYYSTGLRANRLKSIIRPDGTLETYDYDVDSTGNYFTNMTALGAQGGNYSYVAEGTTNITVTNRFGGPVLAVAKNLGSSGNGVVLSQATYGSFDDYGRAASVTYLDGTKEETSYGCCGVETTKDRDGVQTQYLRDSAKRQIGQVRMGITTSNLLDAAGRVLRSVRVGSNGPPVVLSEYQYNVAGDLIGETNALAGVTAYSTTTDSQSGETTRTTTYPDTGTRIETYFRDGTLKRVSGTAVQAVRYEYGIENSGPDQNKRFVKEIRLNASDLSDTSEWTKTYTDAMGRTYKTLYPDGACGQLFYNSKGQLWKEQDPDGVITLYAFNEKGESEYMIAALSDNARTINYESLRSGLTGKTFQSATSPDRITQLQKSVVAASGSVPDFVRVDTVVWKDNQATGSTISRTETSTDGTRTWHTVWRNAGNDATKAVTQSVTVYDRPNRKRTTTVTAADGTQSVSVYQDGRPASVARTDNTSSHNVVTSATYDYNEHGLQKTVTDSRNGATSYTYNNADLLYTVTTPVPATGQSAQTTTSFYNKMLQLTNVVYPDNTDLTNWYEQTGLLSLSAGSRSYPVGYTYDYAGRMKTMKTWRNSADPNTAAITTWNYDLQRGWLQNKRYANPLDGTAGTVGVDYTYTPGGRLWTRTWARTGTGGARIVTTYGYGLSAGSWHGDLVSVQYANDPTNTPATTYSYDRLGRRSQAVRSGITSNLSYDDVGEPLSEGFTGGVLNGFSVAATYNNSLQRDSLSLGGLSGYSVSYGYDTAGRLWTVSQGGSVATYGYIDKSALVGQIGFAHNGTTRMTTTKQADFINRLQSVSSSASATVSYNYGYNSANQRTNVTLADSSYWVYTYDNLGQVTSGKKFWSDRTPVAGQQFEYVFDQIGNRTSAKTGGDSSGANLHGQTYTPDFLNRYSSRTVPGYAQMLGTANASANVTLWTAGPTYVQTSRKGDYFWGELQVNSGINPVYAGITNIAFLKDGSNPDILTKAAGNVFVPGSTENFGYDSDGNLTSDSRWNYTWDAENRLIKVESLASAPAGSKRRLEFAYDYQGRRIWERVTNLDTSAATEQRFLYDGWNLVATINGSTASIVESFVWGLDLSGSLQGAGGVGGLLKVTYNGTQTTNAFVACDGNGNVCALADAANGSIIGQYEYGPFGELLRATGPMAKANPFRLSNKYQDDETDLLYYGYRYYNASAGRWLSRDPAEEEQGGANLYGYVGNDPVRFIDALGLWKSGAWGTQHKDLTVNALNTALAQQNLSEACKSKIRDILVDANEGQDKGAAANEMFRHFNRKYIKGETPQEVTQGRANARREYAVYTMGEEISFYYIPDCWERLKALGRVSHSWQDYYAHGIHTSRGFVDPIGGSPTSFGEFWPSSYNAWNAWESGEHPNRAEPVEVSSRRYQQAEAYTALRFRKLLVDYWLPSCKCLCQ